MAEISLQCSGIDALVGQCVAAGVSEHVWMDLEPNLGFVAGAGEQLGEARKGERAAALRGEDKGRGRLGASAPAAPAIHHLRGDAWLPGRPWRAARASWLSRTQSMTIAAHKTPTREGHAEPIKIMVASRCPCRLDLRAATINFSTSLPVR
jgi:hypothetical protein